MLQMLLIINNNNNNMMMMIMIILLIPNPAATAFIELASSELLFVNPAISRSNLND
jgi:hypothetical protein